MKDAWKEVINHNQTVWITDMNTALSKAMAQALSTGDIDSIKKISEMLNITVKDIPQVDIDVNSSEVVDAIKDFATKLPD